MDAKDEIKKTLLTEPFKLLLQAALPTFAVVILSLIPIVREQVWPLIPRWFLLALSAVLISLTLFAFWRVRRLKEQISRLESSQISPVYPSVYLNPQQELGEPNIICREKYRSHVRGGTAAESEFYETDEASKSGDAFLLTFSNDPIPGKAVRMLEGVKAQVTFNSLDGKKELAWVKSAFWLGTRSRVRFTVGNTQKLLLCFVDDSGFVTVDNDPAVRNFILKRLDKDAKNGFRAVVKLLDNDQWMQEYVIIAERAGSKRWNISQLINAGTMMS